MTKGVLWYRLLLSREANIMNKKTIFVSGILAALAVSALKAPDAMCELALGSAYSQAQGAMTNPGAAYDGSGISPSHAKGSSKGAFTSSWGSSGSQSATKFTAQAEKKSTLQSVKEWVGKAKPYLLAGGVGAFAGFCLLGPAGIVIGALFAIAVWWMMMET